MSGNDMTSTGGGQRVVALVRDLMFASRVRGAAPKAVVAQSRERLLESVGPRTALVIVELEAPGALEALRGVRERFAGVRVVAFAPHVMEDVLESAREAGAEVLPRGAFVKRLPELVASASAGDGSAEE